MYAEIEHKKEICSIVCIIILTLYKKTKLLAKPPNLRLSPDKKTFFSKPTEKLIFASLKMPIVKIYIRC